MIRQYCYLIGLLLCTLTYNVLADVPPMPTPAVEDANDGKSFRVLAFHDIRENLRASFETYPDATAIDDRALNDMFTWLKDNNYHPVSVDQIIAAREGKQPLPSRAILLTFDDGYRSFYTHVYPLLKAYNYPAVQALITGWVGHSAQEKIAISDKISVPGDYFLNWEQVSEMQKSGLVEFASHTHNLHHGQLGNPQGNELPAAPSLLYMRKEGRYETEDEYKKRVTADFKTSSELIAQHTGHAPRIIVWPYGAYQRTLQNIASQLGMKIMFTLDPGPNPPSKPLDKVSRILISYDLTPAQLKEALRSPETYGGDAHPVERVVQVDLDYVYDDNPQQLDRNLSCLLDRIKDLAPTSVWLQAFADPKGDGQVRQVYFPNSVMPMRADLFNRVSWQLHTRTGVNVYAWMPVLGLTLPDSNPAAKMQVMGNGGNGNSVITYPRLSPFEPEVRKTVEQLYYDLARHAPFQGILFHDDVTLGDGEDARPAALETYKAWGLPADINAIKASPELMARWSQLKTRYLIDFTKELSHIVAENQYAAGDLITARNLYTQPIFQPQAEQRYAQNLPDFLNAYDYIGLMAMPYMEESSQPKDWLTSLYNAVAKQPKGIAKTVFELQTRDWRTGKPIDSRILVDQMTELRSLGARHWGYYPDGFLDNQPNAQIIRPLMSTQASVIPREAIRSCNEK